MECNYMIIYFFLFTMLQKTEILYLLRVIFQGSHFNIPFQNEQYGFVKKID